MAESNVLLTPVQELAPGRVAAIREDVIQAAVSIAASGLGKPVDQLVVRDIRAYNDLGFGNNTDYMATATSTDVWGTFKTSDAYVTTAASSGAYYDAIADNTTMADNRYIVLYGIRDRRISRPTTRNADVSALKFTIGVGDRCIWDVTKCEAYRDAIAGITPSAVVIPPLAPYQISCYLMAGSTEPGLQLMGVVVEPVGLTIVPSSLTLSKEERAGKISGARQVQSIPVAELAPGAVTKLRNDAIADVLAMASSELGLPEDKLVVRDLRPYSDLAWCTTTNVVTSALTTDRWDATSDDSKVYGQFVGCVTAASTTMANERFVVITGVRDMRLCQTTAIEPTLSMIKINVGGNDQCLWDLCNMYAYPLSMAAVCPRGIIIPQDTDYQIYLYGGLSDDGGSTNVAQYIQLEGVVVERKGKVLSP